MTNDLWKIVLAKDSVCQTSNHRRIQRFLAKYEIDFVQLECLMMGLVPGVQPYVVVTDRSGTSGRSPFIVRPRDIAHGGNSGRLALLAECRRLS